MATLLLPYHQDERLTAGSIPVPEWAHATVVDPVPDGLDQWSRLVRLYDVLGDEVAASVAGGEPTTVLSGDCVAMLGGLAGVQRAGLSASIVWFDAHGDLHTLASSTSGYLGGLPLRMALGGDPDRLSGPLGIDPVPESRTMLVDGRDLDPAEVDYLAASAITRTRVDSMDVDTLPADPVLLHVDLDVIDPGEVPGLRFPAPGGPSAATVLDALRRLLASGRVVVLDVACPWYDPRSRFDADRRADLLAAVTGLPHG